MSDQAAHILILDNQPDEISTFKDMLVKAGVDNIELHPIYQLDAALDNLKQFSYDVFIIDMNIVPGQGEGLLSAVRTISPDIPIILLSDRENIHHINPIIKGDVEDCIVREYLQEDVFSRTVICAIEKRRFQKNLLATEASLQKLVEQIVDGILIVDKDRIIQHANIFAETMFGFPKGGLIGELFQYPLVSNGKMLIQIPYPDSKSLSVEMYVVPTEWKHEPVYMVILRDITEQQQAQERLRLSAQVFETTAEGIFITDDNSNIISANQAFTDITGYALQEVLGKHALEFHSDQRDCEFFRQNWNSIAITERWQGEVWNRRKDGEIYPEWVTVSTVKDDRGELTNYIAIFTDISSRKQSEERLRYLATHDPLTDLPNRLLSPARFLRARISACSRRS